MKKDENTELEVDVRAVINRVQELTHIDTLKDLASKIGQTQQALSASLVRNSITLPILLKLAKLAGNCSIDYLLFGNNTNSYIQIPWLDDPNKKPLLFHSDLLPKAAADSPSDLAVFIDGDRLYIIDKRIKPIKTGRFAFGTCQNPIIYVIHFDYSGKINLFYESGKENKSRDVNEDIDIEDLLKHVIGRVIWHGGEE